MLDCVRRHAYRNVYRHAYRHVYEHTYGHAHRHQYRCRRHSCQRAAFRHHEPRWQSCDDHKYGTSMPTRAHVTAMGTAMAAAPQRQQQGPPPPLPLSPALSQHASVNSRVCACACTCACVCVCVCVSACLRVCVRGNGAQRRVSIGRIPMVRPGFVLLIGLRRQHAPRCS